MMVSFVPSAPKTPGFSPRTSSEPSVERLWRAHDSGNRINFFLDGQSANRLDSRASDSQAAAVVSRPTGEPERLCNPDGIDFHSANRFRSFKPSSSLQHQRHSPPRKLASRPRSSSISSQEAIRLLHLGPPGLVSLSLLAIKPSTLRVPQPGESAVVAHEAG